ncbi:MAG TPA: hypothetical protein VN364_14195 [Bellilinea sp.]|nr:hypothetical protein [Bellilinea sp.]
MSHKTGASSTNDFSEEQIAKFEERLMQLTPAFPYPPTPDIAKGERLRLDQKRSSKIPRRRLAMGLAVLFIALAAAVWISPVRAQILDWFRIGSVKIFLFEPTPTPTEAISTGTPAPIATPTFLESILDLAGETTLQEAREQADFTVALPSYPADLNDPDRVFVQQFGGPVVTLVWMDPIQPEKVRMTLSESNSEKAVFEKINPTSLQETQVNDNPAVWVDSDYLLIMRNGEATFTRMIDQGQTLIWTNGEITYRLETEVDLQTAIRIAESIR